MTVNQLLNLCFVEESIQFNEYKIQQISSIHKNTGDFHHSIFVNDAPVLNKKYNCVQPMIHQNQLFFLANKTGLMQLYRYDFKDKAKRITSFKYGVSDYLIDKQRIIIKAKALSAQEVITKQLHKDEYEKIQYQLIHSPKKITSLDQFDTDGYTPYIHRYYSYTTRLSKLSNYNFKPSQKKEAYFKGNLINPNNKQSILIFNNKLRKEILQYFFDKRFNIYCVDDVSEIEKIQGKKFAFFFEDGLLETLPKLSTISKAVGFQSRTDQCISLGLTNETIDFKDQSLVDYWVSLAKSSKMKNVDQINCDVLLVHPQFDYTHPLEEAELLYSALKDRKKDLQSEMMVIPNEKNNFFSEGNMKKQIRLYDAIIGWLKRGI